MITLRQKSAKIINYTPEEIVFKSDKFVNLSNVDRLRDYKNKREYYNFKNNSLKNKRLKSAINDNINNDDVFFYAEDKVEKNMKVPNYMNPQKRIDYSSENW